ncbi:MAG: type II toxin-antitoxin system VapC family toxin [Nitrosospira sp.]|nr:type II toxin-antitoxin system VapC family toxin [Nitrosospira sp.]MDN5881846.1 type II toxin-antitoxin system VapC family toxin [Nitrosospira sp.]MDN5936846.1 type II toxin-antitoxin system VapC family toxin [Nitrosospira sp.]
MNRYLLDTCTFLWLVAGDETLSSKAAEIIRNQNNDIFLSVMSAWEISIKYGANKLPLPQRPDVFVCRQREDHLLVSLPLLEAHVLTLNKLPAIHQDPFDRILVCQAVAESLTILTPDDAISQYPVRTVW